MVFDRKNAMSLCKTSQDICLSQQNTEWTMALRWQWWLWRSIESFWRGDKKRLANRESACMENTYDWNVLYNHYLISAIITNYWNQSDALIQLSVSRTLMSRLLHLWSCQMTRDLDGKLNAQRSEALSVVMGEAEPVYDYRMGQCDEANQQITGYS